MNVNRLLRMLWLIIVAALTRVRFEGKGVEFDPFRG